MVLGVAAAVAFVLFACTNDFDRFQEIGQAPIVADASNDAPTSTSSDGATDGGAVDAGPCRETPDACVAARGTCRDACEQTRKTCDDACTGGGQLQCRQKCSRDQNDCRDTCNDTCRTCAGACSTNGCR